MWYRSVNINWELNVGPLYIQFCATFCGYLFQNYEISSTVRWKKVSNDAQPSENLGRTSNNIEFHRRRERIFCKLLALIGRAKRCQSIKCFFVYTTSLGRGGFVSKIIVKLGLFYAFHGYGRLAAKINW